MLHGVHEFGDDGQSQRSDRVRSGCAGGAKEIVQSEIIVSEIVCYEPGQFTKTHHHPHQDEIFYCIQGKGVVTFSERDDIPVEQGSVVFVPAGIEHGVETVGDERLVLVFAKGPGIPNPDRRKKSQ